MADEVWQRLGNVPYYVEPFVGSAAVLLARPEVPHGMTINETIGDVDGHVVNVWRSLKHRPETVARCCSDPPNSIDMAARREVLLDADDWLVGALEGDPEQCFPDIAGYWIYNQSCFMAAGKSDRGVCTPRMWRNGMGVCRFRNDEELRAALCQLGTRLRYVVMAHGDWKRTVSDKTLHSHGIAGVFLDPPYGVEDRHELYAHDDRDVSAEVFKWAIDNQDCPLLRIAVCGYEGEHDFPETWEKLKWKSHGFVGKRGSQGRENREKERIWFSPNCLKQDPHQLELFEEEVP